MVEGKVYDTCGCNHDGCEMIGYVRYTFNDYRMLAFVSWLGYCSFTWAKRIQRFRIDSESLNKVSVLVVLDLSKVANPLYSLRDKDLLKSKDPQVVSEPEQRLAKKNELKAKETLLMALPDKHQLKFNIHKDAKTLMEAIKKRHQLKILKNSVIIVENSHLIWRNKADLEEQSLDDLFNNLKIYEAEVKGSSTSSQNTQNIVFVSSNNNDSTNESVNVVPVFLLLVLRLQFLLFQMECRSPRDNRNKKAPRRTVPVEVSTSNALVSLCDAVGDYDWSFQAEEETTNYALMAYASLGSSSSSISDNETFSKNLSKLLESQVSDKTGLGYVSQVFDRQVFDYEEFHNYESDDSVPKSPVNDRNVVPIAVLTRSRLVSLNAARPVSTTVPQSTVKSPRPVTHVVNKAHSPIRRPINHIPATKNSNFNKKITIVKVNRVNYVQGLKGNADKASANWGNPQQALKDKGVIDSGCLRHMTGNISFLLDFKEFNGGYVVFRGNPKGGKVTGKGKIKTGKLDFDDVYFVKELKFNLFSVSQMCDKKNSVLFTNTECVVLSSDFKLPDKNHVLLRVPRENNMCNVNLKNVVPSRDLTCLFANATLDESILWHRRLGHINFKTMNKLVKGNLVRAIVVSFLHATCSRQMTRPSQLVLPHIFFRDDREGIQKQKDTYNWDKRSKKYVKLNNGDRVSASGKIPGGTS
nr:ribonuclease H-like domain-containing protein [Tanacetum cinerariifolium]